MLWPGEPGAIKNSQKISQKSVRHVCLLKCKYHD
jgi:hypothetical protein